LLLVIYRTECQIIRLWSLPAIFQLGFEPLTRTPFLADDNLEASTLRTKAFDLDLRSRRHRGIKVPEVNAPACILDEAHIPVIESEHAPEPRGIATGRLLWTQFPHLYMANCNSGIVCSLKTAL
jgi:hypothetical protein